MHRELIHLLVHVRDCRRNVAACDAGELKNAHTQTHANWNWMNTSTRSHLCCNAAALSGLLDLHIKERLQLSRERGLRHARHGHHRRMPPQTPSSCRTTRSLANTARVRAQNTHRLTTSRAHANQLTEKAEHKNYSTVQHL